MAPRIASLIALSVLVFEAGICAAKPQDRVKEVPVDNPVQLCRYIMNNVDWVSLGTISAQKETEGYPSVNLVSSSDGPLGNGTGIPYLYVTPFDFPTQDLEKDTRASIMITLAQGSYCKDRNMDPMDPHCARMMLTGTMHTVEDAMMDPAVRKSYFDRHPVLSHVPENHKFRFVKMNIKTIALLNTFGGHKHVSVEEYLQA